MFRRRNLPNSTRRRVFSPVGPTDWIIVASPRRNAAQGGSASPAGLDVNDVVRRRAERF